MELRPKKEILRKIFDLGYLIQAILGNLLEEMLFFYPWGTFWIKGFNFGETSKFYIFFLFTRHLGMEPICHLNLRNFGKSSTIEYHFFLIFQITPTRNKENHFRLVVFELTFVFMSTHKKYLQKNKSLIVNL